MQIVKLKDVNTVTLCPGKYSMMHFYQGLEIMLPWVRIELGIEKRSAHTVFV